MVHSPSGRKLRRKPGPATRTAEEKRSDRLTLRAHEDLLEILTVRADEAGVSRSHYIERLLIKWLNIDPRNPQLDAMGRIKPGPTPQELGGNALRTAERWQRFVQTHEGLFSMAPPRDWLEDPESYWPAAKDRYVQTRLDRD